MHIQQKSGRYNERKKSKKYEEAVKDILYVKIHTICFTTILKGLFSPNLKLTEVNFK